MRRSRGSQHAKGIETLCVCITHHTAVRQKLLILAELAARRHEILLDAPHRSWLWHPFLWSRTEAAEFCSKTLLLVQGTLLSSLESRWSMHAIDEGVAY